MDSMSIHLGQRVRVTLVQPRRGWKGRELITIPAGVQYDGIVHDLSADGFFELHQTDGLRHSWSAHDTSIVVVQL